MMLPHDSHARPREHIVKLLLSKTTTAMNVCNGNVAKSMF
jgi:hypothetical protein